MAERLTTRPGGHDFHHGLLGAGFGGVKELQHEIRYYAGAEVYAKPTVTGSSPPAEL